MELLFLFSYLMVAAVLIVPNFADVPIHYVMVSTAFFAIVAGSHKSMVQTAEGNLSWGELKKRQYSMCFCEALRTAGRLSAQQQPPAGGGACGGPPPSGSSATNSKLFFFCLFGRPPDAPLRFFSTTPAQTHTRNAYDQTKHNQDLTVKEGAMEIGGCVTHSARAPGTPHSHPG